MRTTSALIALTLLAGCGKPDALAPQQNSAATHFTPPQVQPPAPIAGQAHDMPLTGYVGHYPGDAVHGVSFFDRTEVANALIAAVGDAKLREMITGRDGVTVPIFIYHGKIAAHGCEAHNCEAHDWTFLMARDASSATLCLHDAALMGDTSQWYDNDQPVSRPGNCPQV